MAPATLKLRGINAAVDRGLGDIIMEKWPRYAEASRDRRRGRSRLRRYNNGEMAEWSIAAVLKTVVRVTGPGVRIPLSPLTNHSRSKLRDFYFLKDEPGSPR